MNKPKFQTPFTVLLLWIPRRNRNRRPQAEKHTQSVPVPEGNHNNDNTLLTMAPPSRSNTPGTTSTPRTARKRRRQEDVAKLRQYGVDLPDIPGLPVPIIPLQIHAGKQARTFFRHATDQAVAPYTQAACEHSVSDCAVPAVATDSFSHGDAAPSVVDAILHRVATSTTAQSSPRQQAAAARERRMHESVQVWLEAVHRQMRDQPALRSTIPVAALEYWWDLVCDGHQPLATRRAAFYLAGHLLQKSADARKWLLENGTRIIHWMDSLEQVVKGPNDSANTLPAFQQEGFWLLRYLRDQDYGSLYPTLAVALQRFEQMYPHVHEASLSDGVAGWKDIVALRQYRDQAMRYSEKERRRVQTLVQRCHQCTDVLVPRLGVIGTEESGGKEKQGESDDSDGDSIEWEEGWEATDPFAETNTTAPSHEDAVEHTLATMQAIGGLRDGGLDIRLGNFESDEAPHGDGSILSAEQLVAQGRLQKCILLLHSRHMPRLTLWVEGLTKADALIPNASKTALIQMSSDQNSHRQEVLSELMRLKAETASCLSAARRLGMKDGTTVPTTMSVPTETPTTARSSTVLPVHINLGGSTRHEALVHSMARRKSGPGSQDVTRRRSNRIQIKFNRR